MFKGLFFKTDVAVNPNFVSEWDTTIAGGTTDHQIQLPLVNTGTYDFIVDWGDASSDNITTWNQAETLHTYASTGTYTVTITGQCIGWKFANGASQGLDKNKITNISNWGTLELGTGTGFFYGCQNLTVTAEDAPVVVSMSAAFRGCPVLTTLGAGSSLWDTSAVTTFQDCFRSTTSFNDPGISDWDVSSVTTFQDAFHAALVFNQPLNWDVSSATSFFAMFRDAQTFNQDISAWDVSNGTIFLEMFMQTANFNQPLNAWDVSSATNFNAMFMESGFNQSLSSWDVTSVSDFGDMFKDNTVFNSALWTTMSTVVSGVSAGAMFEGATAFNHASVGSWDMSRSVGMTNMFRNATSFNQPLPWTTVGDPGGTFCDNMFNGATAFNQNISGWNVENVYGFTGFLTGAAFNTTNYDLLLNAWSLQSLQGGLTFDTDAQYGAGAAAARASIITNASWTINDGGPV